MGKPRTVDVIELKYASAETVLNKITAAFEKYGKANVVFEVEKEYDYGNECSATCYLTCHRDMTLEEEAAYLTKTRKAEEERKAWERKQYEELKKKYEGK